MCLHFLTNFITMLHNTLDRLGEKIHQYNNQKTTSGRKNPLWYITQPYNVLTKVGKLKIFNISTTFWRGFHVKSDCFFWGGFLSSNFEERNNQNTIFFSQK